MSKNTLLLETLKSAQRIEILGDNIYVHEVEYYRPHGADALYVQIDDSTVNSKKYSKVILSVYASTGRYESVVNVENVPGVICLLHLTGIKLEKKELREIKRVECVREVNTTVNHKLQNVILKNISLGGVCFQTDVPLIGKNGHIHLTTLKNENLDLEFGIVKERYNEERSTFTYHCEFNAYPRSVEMILEREVVGLQLQQIKCNK